MTLLVAAVCVAGQAPQAMAASPEQAQADCHVLKVDGKSVGISWQKRITKPRGAFWLKTYAAVRSDLVLAAFGAPPAAPSRVVEREIACFSAAGRLTAFTRLVEVDGTSAVLQNLPDRTVISVKAMNDRGMEGWDWARVRLQE